MYHNGHSHSNRDQKLKGKSSFGQQAPGSSATIFWSLSLWVLDLIDLECISWYSWVSYAEEIFPIIFEYICTWQHPWLILAAGTSQTICGTGSKAIIGCSCGVRVETPIGKSTMVGSERLQSYHSPQICCNQCCHHLPIVQRKPFAHLEGTIGSPLEELAVTQGTEKTD